ncbi:MAG: amino acid permease [Chloroflexi bacterium HGW-Chloroflexi-4]|jgi:amino acid transporter|nr:MAG: amino acid permease [Chloroflexi bacterium HGW-Chloroflexi-4]
MTVSTQSATGNPKGFKKVLRSLDMTLFTVCAILVMDTLAPSAAIGASSISWWIITLILFFIPYGLITAELGTTYPEQGGLYVWIKNAFGEKWAARTTWLYWINVALWMPSVYILFAGMLSQLFFPEMGLWMQIGIGIIMTWITVWIGTMTLETGKWIPNIGAIFKAVIMIVIGVGAFFYAKANGVANDLSFQAILPEWGAGLAFLPVIVYNFMGFELMSGASGEMKNPGKDIPRAIIISGALIAVFYIMGTVGILMALPLDQLGLVSGIVDTLKILLGGTPLGNAVVVVLGVAALYTFLANMVTWTIGANRTAAEAAKEHELPEIFGREHPVKKTPVGAFILTGIVSTVVIILYGFMAGNAEDLFWTLFAFSSMIFLMPYLALFPAFIKLRKSDPKIERPYRVPGGKVVAYILAVICELFIVQAVVLFVWVPGQPMDWAFAAPVLIGVLITLVVGEVLISVSKKKNNAE